MTFNKALLALAIATTLSASLALVPDDLNPSSSAYARDSGDRKSVV